MDLNVWCILASILLVSVGGARFDQGPQRFYESSSPAPQSEVNTATKDVILYLTPKQIKALEAGGAVVRSVETEKESASEESQEENEESEERSEQEQEQEEEQEQYENENEQPQQQEEPEQIEQPQQSQESNEEDQSLDLEEIFRILNEEQLAEQEAKAEQARNEPQVTEENTQDEREIPERFLVRPKQQQQQQQKSQEKTIAPTEKKTRSKIYSSVRYQLPNEKTQKIRVQQEETYRLVPYEVEEKPEEQPQEQPEQEEQQAKEEQSAEQEQSAEEEEDEIKTIINPDRLADFISQRKNKLFQNEIELQSILQELKQSPKHNDQKYAIEIEKLRANIEKQNTLAKAEVIAKTTPQLIKKEIQKRLPSSSGKQTKASAPAARLEQQTQRQGKPQPVSVEIIRPVPIPIIKKQKIEVSRPVPVEFEKRIPVPITRNVYVKVDKPYLVERIVPVEIRKEIPVEIPIRRPEKVTILRHIWEH